MPDSKPTLNDIYQIVNRVEDKLDRRLKCVEDKVDGLESFRDNLMGRITILTVIATTVMSIIVAFIKDLLNRA